MPTYLYCLGTGRAEPPDGLTGVDGAIVHTIHTSGLMAWVSDVREKVTPTVDRVKAHDAVCAAAMAAGETPLPIRFGQTFHDDTAVASGVAARESELRSRLARIAGCVELRLVMRRDDDPPSEAPAEDTNTLDAASAATGTPRHADGPGTAFLKRLADRGRADLAREVRCEDVRHAIRSAAKSLIVGQHPCESARGVSFFPVLVRRVDVDAFRVAVAETLRIKPIPLSVLGPFAPYSFAGDA
jgi:gas vesicle protein GvpL/GvpF